MYCGHFLSSILVIFIYFTFNSTIMDMKVEHYTNKVNYVHISVHCVLFSTLFQSIIKSVIHLIAFSDKSAQILPEILHNKKLMQKNK